MESRKAKGVEEELKREGKQGKHGKHGNQEFKCSIQRFGNENQECNESFAMMEA